MNSFPKDLAARLLAVAAPLPSVTIGFDGFMDEMISLVGERQSLAEFKAVPDITTFGELITKAAGHSSLREIVVNGVHPGGCAINMGDGLAAFGVPVDGFATLGEPVHPAFASVIAGFTPEHVATMLADGAYATACATARVIALTDWSLYPHMTAVWRLLQEKVYARLVHRPAFFIDLVDPSSRSPGDIRAMLDTLSAFAATGAFTLGLNGNEANILARLLGLPAAGTVPESVPQQAHSLRERLGIAEVVIHHIKFAAVANATETAIMDTFYCAKPKKSTGAGDRFNAGYCLGLLLKLDARSRLVCANASAGFFVREARSASLPELAQFILTLSA